MATKTDVTTDIEKGMDDAAATKDKPPVELTEDVKEVPEVIPGPNADASLSAATVQPTVISAKDPAVDYSEQGLVDAAQAKIDEDQAQLETEKEEGKPSIYERLGNLIETDMAGVHEFVEKLEAKASALLHPKVLVHGSHNAAMAGLQTDASGSYAYKAPGMTGAAHDPSV